MNMTEQEKQKGQNAERIFNYQGYPGRFCFNYTSEVIFLGNSNKYSLFLELKVGIEKKSS